MIRKIRPKALCRGDTVAAVSPSFGGPSVFPHRYQAGKNQFEAEFGIKVVEMPHTLKDARWLSENPEARAQDVMQAFSDPKINGIVATIGGDDSIRLLPYLDLEVIRSNPKAVIGYSDNTVLHFACLKAGLTSFYGPTILSGFGENCGLHRYLVDSFRRVVCSEKVPGIVAPNADGWTVEFLDWAEPANQNKLRKVNPPLSPRWLQGSSIVEGHLIGGCLEVVDWLRGTSVWPDAAEWDGAILFLETSEEAPTPGAVERYLRSLGAIGVLNRINGLLFGRPGGNIDPAKFGEYDQAVLNVVSKEFRRCELPIVSQMDFGHTDPIMTLPLGIRAQINCSAKTFSLLESAVLK